MTGNLTFMVIREVVTRTVAEVQRRPVEYYDDKPNLVLGSCDLAAVLPRIETELGCAPFKPSHFAPAAGGGHGGICYDPIDDIPIGDLCRVVGNLIGTVSGVR